MNLRRKPKKLRFLIMVGMILRGLFKSVNRKALAFMIIIFLYYFATRLYGISGHMNEYFDYDEGTYLMIARLINHGYLPYRDIFAVHPPLFYYLLALWLRVFGDNYVVGRLFSVFLGSLSLIVAYYVGREARNWKLGVVFAGLLAMDPLLIHVNPLVFHETSIEFFTLLSLYYFVRYTKERNLRHAYISLFWAGLGSTLKFTILPFALALYLTIFFSLNREIFKYFKNAGKVLLNRKQVFIGLISCILITLISMSAIFLYPTELIRRLMIVPGFHKMEVYGQIIPSSFLLAIWGILTVYVFKVSYTDKLIKIAVYSIKNIGSAILLGLAFLFPKILIEGTLGLLISEDYLHQTYLAQGSRGFPVINLFMYIGDKFTNIYNNALELLMANVPLMLLIIAIFLVWILKLKSESNYVRPYLKVLFIVSIFVYFFVSPIIPNDRFLLPMWIVLYLLLLDFLSSVRFTKKQIHTLLSMGLIVLLISDYGMVYQYPQGKLKLIWAVHSKEMRDELKEFIFENNLSNEKFYAINPMNTYYLNLQTEPYYIDTFGLIVLKGINSSQILMNLSESDVDYYIFGTWSYFYWPNPLRSQLEHMALITIARYNLIYGDSYKNGEILELYKKDNTDTNILRINSYKGALQIWINETKVFKISMKEGNKTYDFRTKIISLTPTAYEIIQYNEKGERKVFDVYIGQDFIMLKCPSENTVAISFEHDIAALVHNKLLPVNQSVISNYTEIYLPDYRIKMRGANVNVLRKSSREIQLTGDKIEFLVSH